MPRTNQWKRNKETNAFLVALDIAGFSRYMKEPDQLLAHRERFFRAVANTALFDQAKRAKTVVAHFLGDELRLGFLDSVEVKAIYDFLNGVMDILDKENLIVKDERQTHVKEAVLVGVMTWKVWWKCSFLDGLPPFKAQQWMGTLQPGEIVADGIFKNAIEHFMPTTHIPVRDFVGETGYLLRGGI